MFGQFAYDGFGNPIGMIPGLAPGLSRIGRLFGMRRAGRNRVSLPVPPPLQPFVNAATGQPQPGAPQLMPWRRPLRHFPPPVGWVTPALPYTGMQPRRLYMRCSVWPGAAGLVPQPGLIAPPPLPGGGPGGPGGRRRRRRMRRRR